MKIKYNYNGIDVNAELKNKLNIFFDISASGKTFFFRILQLYCKENGLRYASFDYKSENTEEAMIAYSKNTKVVILDNADLYLTQNLLDSLLSCADYVLISIKDLTKINIRNSSFLRVRYTSDKLEVYAADE